MDVFQPTYLWKKNEKIKSSRDRQKDTCQLYFFFSYVGCHTHKLQVRAENYD